MSSRSDTEAARERLLALREALTSGETARKKLGRTVELDQARTGRLSRLDALQAQEMAKAGQQRVNIQIRQIAAALDRLEAGTYGDCAACAKPIAQARLDTNPATPFCRECAEDRQA